MKKNMFFTAMAVVFSMSAATPLAGQQKPVNEKLEVQRIEKNKKKTKRPKNNLNRPGFRKRRNEHYKSEHEP